MKISLIKYYLIITFSISNILNLSNLFSQEISGSVYELNENKQKGFIVGATVYWMKSTIATTTDANGNFNLITPDTLPAKLIVNMIGFKSDTINVTKTNIKLDVLLKPNLTLKEIEIKEKQESTLISTLNPINTEIITEKELQKAACCNLSESFTTNSSVEVISSDAVSGSKKIQMLGLDGVYTQILSENIPLLRGLGLAYGLNFVPGTWIEKIMITKGTGSVVNGYESISGQINLEFFNPETNKNKLFVNLYGNHRGRAEVNTHLTKRLNDKWSSMLFAHVSEMDHNQDRNKDSFLDMPKYKQYNFLNRWSYKSKKHLEAQLLLKTTLEKRKGGQTNFNYYKDYNTNNCYGIGINTNQYEYQSKTAYVFTKPATSIGLQTIGKIQYQDMFFGKKIYKAEENYFYANLIFSSYINNTNHKYKLGSSFVYDKYNEKFVDSLFIKTENVPGIFGEYTYSSGDKFSIVAGIRADFHNMFGDYYSPRLHIKYIPFSKTTIRVSVGKGFRVANIFVENQNIFANSRKVFVDEQLLPEEAINYGISFNQRFFIFGRTSSINIDFFRTEFINQTVIDLDKHANEIHFYNLKGISYANSFQADYNIDLNENISIKAAYKWYEVKTTYDAGLLDKPFVFKDRVLAGISYATFKEKWKIDLAGNWIGQSRIPNTSTNPIEYQLKNTTTPYYLLQGQITRRFKSFDFYVGCENILDYVQPNPIISAENPFGTYFDASMIYAPTDGRIIYLGMRLNIKP